MYEVIIALAATVEPPSVLLTATERPLMSTFRKRGNSMFASVRNAVEMEV